MTFNTGSIPARDRFLSGHDLTDCDDDITIGIEQLEVGGFEVFPNPTSGIITIRHDKISKEFKTNIIDLNGKIIFSKIFSGKNNVNTIELPEKISPGIYLMQIISGERKFVKKVVIIE